MPIDVQHVMAKTGQTGMADFLAVDETNLLQDRKGVRITSTIEGLVSRSI
jgi:hypothetical protein